MFLLDEGPLEEWNMTDIVSDIADFDRSTLPQYSPFYSNPAMTFLHQRLAVLTLVLVSTIESEPIRQRVDLALEHSGTTTSSPFSVGPFLG